MNDSVISLLNRRFISSYFNTKHKQGVQPGFDRDGMRYVGRNCASLGHNIQYGGLFTPDQKFVNSFGFKPQGFVRALKEALHKHPECDWLSPDEKDIYDQARDHMKNVQSQLAAAELDIELMKFKAARDRLKPFLNTENKSMRVRVLHLTARSFLLNLEKDEKKQARGILEDLLSNTELTLSGKAREAIEMDCLWSQVSGALYQNSITNSNGRFFNGYRFYEDTDCKKIAADLDDLLRRFPQGRRRGQILFTLGLARYFSGKENEANRIWEQHIREMPEDRWVLLSRVHHKSYLYGFQGLPKSSGS